jgi:uncharacterized SAM-binding protein YcdF (DUF218 family)
VIARLVLGLVAAWIVLCLVFFTWSPWAEGAPARADAVVVLSGGLNARLDPALALMRGRVAPTLVVSGATHDRKWPKAQRLCRGGFDVRYRVECFEPSPFSTRGEARAIARLARAHGWRNIVVVTSRFHVTRTKLLVGRCWHGRLELVGTPTPWWRAPINWVSETGKLAVQLVVRRGC